MERQLKIEDGPLAGEAEINFYDGHTPQLVFEFRCLEPIKIERMELTGGEVQLVISRNWDR